MEERKYTLCSGVCSEHGKPCLAVVDADVIKMANIAAKKLGTKKLIVKNGVMKHRHVCEDCLGV